MNRILVGLVLVAMMVAGCARMPDGIQASLYTAEITLATTMTDVDANRPPYGEVEGESAEAKAARLEKAVDLLVRTMGQADANLVEVIRWSQGSEEGLKDE